MALQLSGYIVSLNIEEKSLHQWFLIKLEGSYQVDAIRLSSGPVLNILINILHDEVEGMLN